MSTFVVPASRQQPCGAHVCAPRVRAPRKGTGYRRLIGVALCAALVFLPLGTSSYAKPGGPPGSQGTYDLTFAGALTGDGHATVTPNKVNLHGKVVDAAGNNGNLVAPNLDMNDGRFNGTGKVFGSTVNISGRVEGADGTTIKVVRILANYDVPGIGNGRIVGERKGP